MNHIQGQDPRAITNKPLAAPGLLSFRLKALYGWIMIGAKDEAEALKEARRSAAEARIERLEKWNGHTYVPCQGSKGLLIV